jgi:uncharacterized protein (TIGR03435 family)
MQRMLQPLLAQYFKLEVRREKRDMAVLVLVVATPGRLGPKIRKNEASCDDRVGTTSSLARAPEGAPDAPGTCGILPGGAGRIVVRGLDIAGFAEFLGTVPGGMVIDRTGLTGRYDIDLTYTPQAFSAAALAQRPGATVPPGVDPAGPPIATALLEQLGFKLERTRAPIDVIVITRAEPLSPDAPPPQASSPPPAGPVVVFEAASIKVNMSGDARRFIQAPPNGLNVTNMDLKGLVLFAYDLRPFEIAGGGAYYRG